MSGEPVCLLLAACCLLLAACCLLLAAQCAEHLLSVNSEAWQAINASLHEMGTAAASKPAVPSTCHVTACKRARDMPGPLQNMASRTWQSADPNLERGRTISSQLIMIANTSQSC
jgi:hypothetical protein